MRRSRLRKRSDKKNITTILLSVFGIIVILFVLLKFGLSLLVNVSLFFSNGKNQTVSQNSINFITPPVLDPISSATNSAKIVITGKSIKNLSINLYINGQNEDQITTDDKGNFKFTEELSAGTNEIKAVAVKDNKKSDFSNILNILYKNSKPNLTINSPSDGQSFKKDQNTVSVSGTTDIGTSVTVNGFWAVTDDNNNFSYTLPLQNGDNEIKVLATDQAGNQTEKDVKVNYSQ